MNDSLAVLTFVVMLILMVLGVGMTHDLTCHAWKDEAVKQGKAEYYLDADNQRQWRWKP